MSKYFYCCKCKKRTRRNVRLKQQSYCGSQACQQARKNAWELKKKRSDPSYRQGRMDQHASWLKKKGGGDSYQRTYRERRMDYAEKNRLYQKVRNLLSREVSLGLNMHDIVKTDALTSARPIQSGLYEISSIKTRCAKKIVKTDTLFAVISIHQGIPDFLVTGCKDGRD